jgi:hypothetical protein
MVVRASAKSSAEFKPGRSPARLTAGQLEFVVSTPLAASSADFNSMYALRSLQAKRNKRELVIAKAHGYIVPGTTSANANLAEGEIPIVITKYGQHSLKITPSSPLPPGEYAVSMRAAFLDLFCFGVGE